MPKSSVLKLMTNKVKMVTCLSVLLETVGTSETIKALKTIGALKTIEASRK